MHCDSRLLTQLAGSASLLVFLAQGALAQTPVTLDKVVVTTAGAKTKGEADQKAAADVEISREQIQATQPQDLKQLFSQTPSVNVAGGSAASQKFYVHGIDESKLNIKVDGARQKNNVWHHNGNTGIDPIFLKSVYLNEGVAPADFGPGSLGGSVLFQTVSARDLLEDGKTHGGFVSLGYDTNSKTFKTTSSGYAAINGFEMLGGLTRQEGQDYTTGAGKRETGTAADMWNGLGKLAYQSAEGHRIEGSAEYFRDDGFRRLRTNMGAVTPQMNQNLYERFTATAKYTKENAEGLFDPEVLFYYNQNSLKRPNKSGYTRPSGAFNSDVQSIGGHAQNRFNFDFGSITAGVDFYRDHIHMERFHFRNNVSETIWNVGAYTQARVSPIEKLDISAGLRADFQSYRAVDGQTFDNAGVSPNLDVTYELLQGLKLQGGYGYVFSGLEQAETAFFHAANYQYAKNLNPTYAHNAKVGLDYTIGGLNLGAKLFYIKVVDPVDYNFTTLTRINGQDLVSKGFDLTARYSVANASVFAAFTHAEIEYGNRIALSGDYNNGVPVGDTLSVGGSYLFTDYNIEVGANADIAFQYSNDDLAKNGYNNPIKGYQVVDVFAQWKTQLAKTDLTLRAEVNNLFDEEYYSRGSYNATSRIPPVYSPGRSFYLSASAKF